MDALPPVEGEAVLPKVWEAAHRGRHAQEGTAGPGRGQVLPDGDGDPQVQRHRLRHQLPVHEPDRPGPAEPASPRGVPPHPDTQVSSNQHMKANTLFYVAQFILPVM